MIRISLFQCLHPGVNQRPRITAHAPVKPWRHKGGGGGQYHVAVLIKAGEPGGKLNSLFPFPGLHQGGEPVDFFRRCAHGLKIAITGVGVQQNG